MKTAILILFVLACIAYSASPTITIKPLKVEFERPYTGMGILFLLLAYLCVRIDGYKQGQKDAYKAVKAELENLK